METTREIALRTYKEAIAHGMMDTQMNWHIWKRAFYTAESELKNLQLGAVSRSANTDEYTKGYRDGWGDCCKDQKEFEQ
jgi:hypothetical protein